MLERKYFKRPTLLNFINFKKAIKQSKASSWRDVSTINSHSSIKSVWKKIRKFRGKETTPKIHMKKNTILISDPKEQANYLAESFFPKTRLKIIRNLFGKTKTAKSETPLIFPQIIRKIIINLFYSMS